jgi:hypothetical protein
LNPSSPTFSFITVPTSLTVDMIVRPFAFPTSMTFKQSRQVELATETKRSGGHTIHTGRASETGAQLIFILVLGARSFSS